MPEGCAHGFLVLTETALFQYKCTGFYEKKAESSLIWSDPSIGIDWPSVDEVILSKKDQQAPLFDPQKLYFK